MFGASGRPSSPACRNPQTAPVIVTNLYIVAVCSLSSLLSLSLSLSPSLPLSLSLSSFSPSLSLIPPPPVSRFRLTPSTILSSCVRFAVPVSNFLLPAGRRTPVRSLQAGGSAVHVLCEGGGPIQVSGYACVATPDSIGEGSAAVSTSSFIDSGNVGGIRGGVGAVNRSNPQTAAAAVDRILGNRPSGSPGVQVPLCLPRALRSHVSVWSLYPVNWQVYFLLGGLEIRVNDRSSGC